MLRIGVISSSNGGAFKAFYRLSGLSKEAVTIVTDRECGIEQFAKEELIDCKRIQEKDNVVFSKNACDYLTEKGGVDVIFLFYTRLVTVELFENYFTVNFHPSLSPAFTGFSPVKRALKVGVKYFGTTAHIVSAQADEGKILCQSSIPVLSYHDEAALEKVSFIQKVYQMTLLSEMLTEGAVEFKTGDFAVLKTWPATLLFNPALRSVENINKIKDLDKRNQTHIFNLLQ